MRASIVFSGLRTSSLFPTGGMTNTDTKLGRIGRGSVAFAGEAGGDQRTSRWGRFPGVVGMIALCAALCVCTPTRAEPCSIPSESHVVKIDSGVVSATGSGVDPVLVFSQTAGVDRAPWIRLRFDKAQVSGSPKTNDESYLRLTSLEDGAVQIMGSLALRRWANSSAYFNGSEVLVELLAFPGKGKNRVAIGEIEVGIPDAKRSRTGTSNSCPPDTRSPSSDPRSARGIPCGCTVWMFNGRSNCFLTAGHCCDGVGCGIGVGRIQVVEFNVPDSDMGGEINHPPPQDQYPVNSNTILRYVGLQDAGNDWCYFGVYDNTDTGMNPLDAQGGTSYSLATGFPSSQILPMLRLAGYGTDERVPWDRSHSQTQQTSGGSYTGRTGTRVEYRVTVKPGTSGAAIEVAPGQIFFQEVLAINSQNHCELSEFDDFNWGTAVDHPDLQAALQCGCTDCNLNSVPDDCETDARACCMPEGACKILPSECCPNEGGAFLPGITSCEADCGGNPVSNVCDNAGACCDKRGGCTNTTESCCPLPWYSYHGDYNCGDPGLICASVE